MQRKGFPRFEKKIRKIHNRRIFFAILVYVFVVVVMVIYLARIRIIGFLQLSLHTYHGVPHCSWPTPEVNGDEVRFLHLSCVTICTLQL
jgi:hypothetical protein